ncbi:hypothetical protein P692DRAFT_20905128 [Suillus brevipes Sb2]|nr:hypothetical protein P692DRAFT_20905128 [Suillus brevipes Sb2]
MAEDVQPRVVRQPIPNTGGSARYGKDVFADPSNHRTSPPANSSLNWRSLCGFLRFSARPTNAPHLIRLANPAAGISACVL